MTDTEKPRVLILDPQEVATRTGAWVLSGSAYGHPRFKNGTYVQTSEIVSAHGSTVETLNTVYILAERVPVTDVVSGLDEVNVGI